ncbi:porin family protein [Pontibacter ruber]|uniref:Porin family protein n=1 Tax=Pontibacter ruber TaxID=1343895 RepID=A0ABW5D0F9_9BACT|nr:porin family protein [Pontibacter ruber]
MKQFILSVLFLILCTALQAQDQKLQFGAQAGVNLFDISDDPNQLDSDIGLSWQAGVFARIGDKYYVQPGIELMSNKSKVEREFLTEAVRDDLRIRYFRVPVMLGIKLAENEGMHSAFRIQAGPSFSYAVKVKENDLGYDLSDVRKSVFALNGGIGFDFWAISLDLVYHHGISTIMKTGTSEGKGRAVSLSVGFRI